MIGDEPANTDDDSGLLEKAPIKDKLKRFGLFAQFGERRFFPTIGVAVGSYLESHAVEWVDWEDRSPPKTGN